MTKPSISDLLTLRDALREGELPDEQLAQQVAADPQSRAELAKLRQIRSALNELAPVTPDPEVWQAISERTRGRDRRRFTVPFPIATAASVFLAAALAIIYWNPARLGGDAAPGAGPIVNDPVAQLMIRSQTLERQLLNPAAVAPMEDQSIQALLYRIADVDSQLNAQYESDQPDPQEKERLWRERVALLESLSDVQRGQAVLRPAIY
ncbi:MAG: hypothetical protein R3E86_12075 [Pseudomonadales bacterium]